jgi:hypothetical protein
MITVRDIEIPIERLDEAFEVDFERGSLIWRDRPDDHFLRVGVARMMNARFAGKVAGSRHPVLGYIVLPLTLGGRTAHTYAHRVIWAMKHRRWPAHTIDHIDRVRDHNSIGNLREATKAEQTLNAGARKNATGFPGVYVNYRKFSTGVSVGGRYHYLGSFDTPEEAHAAYLAAKGRLHSFRGAL